MILAHVSVDDTPFVKPEKRIEVKKLGKVDVLLAPVDGTWTLSQEDMVQVAKDVTQDDAVAAVTADPSIAKFVTGAPKKITPSVSQKPSTAMAQEMTPNDAITTLHAPSTRRNSAHVRRVLY